MDIGDRVEIIAATQRNYIGRRGIVASVGTNMEGHTFGVLLYVSDDKDEHKLEELETEFSDRDLAVLEKVFWIEY